MGKKKRDYEKKGGILVKFKTLLTAEIDESLLPEINEICDVTIDGWGKELRILEEDELIEKLKGNEILITSYDKVTKKVIDNNPQLKLIVCTRSNPVNIDYMTAAERNIPIVYTPGRNSDCTAEFTIALMLSIANRIPMVYQDLKNGKFLARKSKESKTNEGLREDVTWSLDGNSPYVLYKGVQLKEKTLGIVGYGDIGQKVAQLARAFGMKILVCDPYISEVRINDNVQTKVEFHELLKESDFVSTHVKVVEETRKMFNEIVFKKMKKTAFFINTSRGAVVDEDALIVALREGEICGAALDVYASEPLMEDHPFITELNNVVISPHLGGATYQAITNHTMMVIEDLRNFASGKQMINVYK